MKMTIMRSFLFIVLIGFTQIALALSPKKAYDQNPHDWRMKYEELYIPTSNGLQLYAWFFPSEYGSQTMIISHDGVGNMGDYLERVKILVHYGFNVLIYDYRGYGKSSDFQINKFQYVYKEFYEDFDAVYNFCQDKFQDDIIAYGWGIGAGISVSRGYQKDNLYGIIADEPFVDFSTLKSTFKKIHSVMTLPDGIENSDFNTLNVVKKEPGKNLRGILYLHGSKNFLYSDADMDQLMNATSHDFKELYKFEEASKMDNFTINESEYAKQIYAFVLNL